jgi:2-polyprenyl-3-methyl-5-hydroxy-6-metoxy-1,4-benzoquinol methylase
MLAEHIEDGPNFHKNIYNLLAPSGIAFHFFPTLYAPPFIVNKFSLEWLTSKVLNLFQKGRHSHGNKAKFPAYYSWGKGPTKYQIQRFTSLGYEIVEYIGSFGHSGYYRRLPPIENLHTRLANWLVSNPLPWLTSFAYITLSKPK